MSDLSPIPTAQNIDLTRAEKAAIVVRFLLTQGANLNLSDLPENLQARLTQKWARCAISIDEHWPM